VLAAKASIVVVRSDRLYPVFARLRHLITANVPAANIAAVVLSELTSLGISGDALERFTATIGVLVGLHGQKWDGIWCPILADRFAAGAIQPVSHIAGNPPWVKWSHLPPPYAEFIKPFALK
jgi:hypothetical protein